MKVSEIYNSTELYKYIEQKTTEDGKDVVYQGTARYPRKGYPNDIGFRGSDDFNKPIWRIRKIIYDSDNGSYDMSYPERDVGFSFKRSEKESYNYNGGPINYLSLEDESNIITEQGSNYIIIG